MTLRAFSFNELHKKERKRKDHLSGLWWPLYIGYGDRTLVYFGLVILVLEINRKWATIFIILGLFRYKMQTEKVLLIGIAN